jgi:hypothetical protein
MDLRDTEHTPIRTRSTMEDSLYKDCSDLLRITTMAILISFSLIIILRASGKRTLST